jgi:hypothetical protein
MPDDESKKQLRVLSRGIGNKLFNKKVNDRYEGNQDLIDACLIQPFDSLLESIDKKLTFFLTLENFVPTFEEKIYLRNKPKRKKKDAQDDETIPWMILHLNFKEKFIKDEDGTTKPLGQRRIEVNNIDENKIVEKELRKAFNGSTYKYGSKYVTYNFNNGKEIRLEHASSEKNGIDLISRCLSFCLDSAKQDGDLDDNILTVNKPKNTKKVDTHGLVGYIYRITFYKQQGKRTTKIYSLLLSNKARE